MINQFGRFGGAVFAFLFLASTSAWAHHPIIEGEAVCSENAGGYDVIYTATAWEGYDGKPESRENPEIEVLMNGIRLEVGAFEDPNYSFGDTVPAPSGSQPGGEIILTAVANAEWGSGTRGGQSDSTVVIVPDDDCGEPLNGRFTGGGHQIIVGGVRVTRGLTLHCDLLLSNNLEINWQGNSFHTLEHLDTIECSDDPNIGQAPPPAPIDTLIGTGVGRYNGDEGYSIKFTLVDGGEPGGDDQMAILVYETGNMGNVILDVPLQNLTGGNLQAHYDQPHK
jgi:hypothetical protein